MATLTLDEMKMVVLGNIALEPSVQSYLAAMRLDAGNVYLAVATSSALVENADGSITLTGGYLDEDQILPAAITFAAGLSLVVRVDLTFP